VLFRPTINRQCFVAELERLADTIGELDKSVLFYEVSCTTSSWTTSPNRSDATCLPCIDNHLIMALFACCHCLFTCMAGNYLIVSFVYSFNLHWSYEIQSKLLLVFQAFRRNWRLFRRSLKTSTLGLRPVHLVFDWDPSVFTDPNKIYKSVYIEAQAE
jgi:hypothetical protein